MDEKIYLLHFDSFRKCDTGRGSLSSWDIHVGLVSADR